MKTFWENYLRNNFFFWLFSLIGVALIITGFVLPPLGIIDNSVLVAVGEIDGFIALGCLLKAIDKGVDASVKHNGTEITITNDDKEGK